MHDSGPNGIMHIFGNMFGLWMFGSLLEEYMGPKRFLTFYIISGLGAAVCHLTVLYFENIQLTNLIQQLPAYEQMKYEAGLARRLNEATLGASGAVFGCLAAFAYLFPNMPIYLYFLFPIKAKWLVLFYTVFELYAGIRRSAGDNIAHFAHLGGALAGFLFVYFWKKNNRRRFY